MENEKKTREPLDDDALGGVTGGFTDAVDGGFPDIFAPFAEPDRGFAAEPMTRSSGGQWGRYWCWTNRDWAVDDWSGKKDIYKICPKCGETEIVFTNSIYL